MHRGNGQRPLAAYFGHHKCATRWVNGIVRRVCDELGLKQVIYNSARQFDNDLAAAVEQADVDFLCYCNAVQSQVDLISEYHGFHMVRDPRDIAVSAYFSHRYSHPIREGRRFLTPEYRAQLEELDEEAGLLLSLDRRRAQFEQMLVWDYDNPRVLEARFEDVTADPFTWFRRILDFVGLTGFPDASLERVLADSSFAKKTRGREVGDEDVRSHYRKGISGDWMNHFTSAHVDYFKEHYNDVLLALGYEDDPDWSL